MAFEMSLLELLALASKGRNGDPAVKEQSLEAASNLIVPFDATTHSAILQSGNYGQYASRLELDSITQLGHLGRRFIPDDSIWFYIAHGGFYERRPNDVWVNGPPIF